jgi:hypothetical protein
MSVIYSLGGPCIEPLTSMMLTALNIAPADATADISAAPAAGTSADTAAGAASGTTVTTGDTTKATALFFFKAHAARQFEGLVPSVRFAVAARDFYTQFSRYIVPCLSSRRPSTAFDNVS